MAAQEFTKDEAKKITEILNGRSMGTGVIRVKPEVTVWAKPGEEVGSDADKLKAKGGSKAAQISLDGMRSFRLPYNTDAERKLVNALKPGMMILFTFGNVDKADAKQNISTFSGQTAKQPTKFTNYFDVDLVFVGKGAPLNTLFDDEIEPSDDDSNVTFVERTSGTKSTTNIPEVGKKGEGAEGAVEEENGEY